MEIYSISQVLSLSTVTSRMYLLDNVSANWILLSEWYKTMSSYFCRHINMSCWHFGHLHKSFFMNNFKGLWSHNMVKGWPNERKDLNNFTNLCRLHCDQLRSCVLLSFHLSIKSYLSQTKYSLNGIKKFNK